MSIGKLFFEGSSDLLNELIKYLDSNDLGNFNVATELNFKKESYQW